MGYHLAK